MAIKPTLYTDASVDETIMPVRKKKETFNDKRYFFEFAFCGHDLHPE
jgi:hypothetical protein